MVSIKAILGDFNPLMGVDPRPPRSLNLLLYQIFRATEYVAYLVYPMAIFGSFMTTFEANVIFLRQLGQSQKLDRA